MQLPRSWANQSLQHYHSSVLIAAQDRNKPQCSTHNSPQNRMAHRNIALVAAAQQFIALRKDERFTHTIISHLRWLTFESEQYDGSGLQSFSKTMISCG